MIALLSDITEIVIKRQRPIAAGVLVWAGLCTAVYLVSAHRATTDQRTLRTAIQHHLARAAADTQTINASERAAARQLSHAREMEVRTKRMRKDAQQLRAVADSVAAVARSDSSAGTWREAYTRRDSEVVVLREVLSLQDTALTLVHHSVDTLNFALKIGVARLTTSDSLLHQVERVAGGCRVLRFLPCAGRRAAMEAGVVLGIIVARVNRRW